MNKKATMAASAVATAAAAGTVSDFESGVVLLVSALVGAYFPPAAVVIFNLIKRDKKL